MFKCFLVNIDFLLSHMWLTVDLIYEVIIKTNNGFFCVRMGGKRNSCQEETDKDQHCHISYSMSSKIDIACHFSHLLKLCSSCLTSRYVPYKESSWRERMNWEWKRLRGKAKHSRTDRWFRSGSVQGIARPSQSNWAASPSHQGQGDGIINQLALSSLPSNTTLLPSLSLVCMPTTPSPSSQLITCLHVRDWSSANRRVMVSTPLSDTYTLSESYPCTLCSCPNRATQRSNEKTR